VGIAKIASRMRRCFAFMPNDSIMCHQMQAICACKQSCKHDRRHTQFPHRSIACQAPCVRTVWLFAGDYHGIDVQPKESPHSPDNLSEIVSFAQSRNFKPTARGRWRRGLLTGWCVQTRGRSCRARNKAQNFRATLSVHQCTLLSRCDAIR
jgi:hypothetical protein